MAWDRKNFAPDVPFLTGTWVILNPESPEYSMLSQAIESTVALVTDGRLSDEAIQKWKTLTPSTRSDHVVNVRFENGQSHSIRNFNLLPLDKAPEAVEHVYLKPSGVTVREYGEELTKILNERIIKRGDRIERRAVFDDAWRKKVLESMN